MHLDGNILAVGQRSAAEIAWLFRVSEHKEKRKRAFEELHNTFHTWYKLMAQYQFTVDAMVCWYNEYQQICEAEDGEVLQCRWETGNRYDFYAVQTVKNDAIGGCSIFMQHGESITCICFLQNKMLIFYFKIMNRWSHTVFSCPFADLISLSRCNLHVGTLSPVLLWFFAAGKIWSATISFTLAMADDGITLFKDKSGSGNKVSWDEVLPPELSLSG